LAALQGDLAWATTWMADANECIAPLISLPQLAVVVWPEPSDIDEQDERNGLHWKTRAPRQLGGSALIRLGRR
jgi:hypothetical protein